MTSPFPPFKRCAVLVVGLLSLAGCSNDKAEQTAISEPEPQAETIAPATLQNVIAHERRGDEKLRDPFRHPQETLEFFGIKPGQHVAEIWPGWYTKILAPYLAANDGTYTAILYPESMGERAQKRVAAFKEAFADSETYGAIQYGQLGKDSGPIMPAESADVILTFRNVHNWMRDGYAEQAFEEFYAALKPGGVLGIVEHRLPESALQDPRGATGYVQESYIKALAKDAGFEFVDSSEINANPKDTADHPFGVWTLPPRSKVPEADSPEALNFNAELFKNIGESDRATLKFIKPQEQP